MSSSTFTLKGQSLKCDTAEEISVHLEALKSDDQVTKVVVGGNTFGIGACEELGKVLKEKEHLVVSKVKPGTDLIITESHSSLRFCLLLNRKQTWRISSPVD